MGKFRIAIFCDVRQINQTCQNTFGRINVGVVCVPFERVTRVDPFDARIVATYPTRRKMRCQGRKLFCVICNRFGNGIVSLDDHIPPFFHGVMEIQNSARSAGVDAFISNPTDSRWMLSIIGFKPIDDELTVFAPKQIGKRLNEGRGSLGHSALVGCLYSLHTFTIAETIGSGEGGRDCSHYFHVFLLGIREPCRRRLHSMKTQHRYRQSSVLPPLFQKQKHWTRRPVRHLRTRFMPAVLSV